MMPMHFGDNPTVPLVNAIDSYNFHTMQHMRLYLQWKKYLYTKHELDVPMQDHVAEITEYFDLAIRLLQQPVATTGVVKSPQYSTRQIY